MAIIDLSFLEKAAVICSELSFVRNKLVYLYYLLFVSLLDSNCFSVVYREISMDLP